MSQILLSIAAGAAMLNFAICPGYAAYIGNAPWCAVVNTGAGNIEWDCQYGSAAACAPNVVAGNRGFCQINPYFSPAPPYGAPHVRRTARHRHAY